MILSNRNSTSALENFVEEQQLIILNELEEVSLKKLEMALEELKPALTKFLNSC